MQNIKTKKKIALSLLLASAVALGGAVIAFGATRTAYAQDKGHEISGTNKVFYTGIRGAEITYSTEGESETHAYTTFKIGADETVEFRKDLAYSWRTSATEVGKFSIEIGFKNTDFERYVIRFQSQQYVLTEDKITENFIVFTPTQDDKLDMYVVQELEDDTVLNTKAATFATGEHIKIAFGVFNDGKYPLIVNGNEVASFKNVYEPFATYVSSGDTAVTPLTFSATFAEGQQDKTADMVLYDINGQSFELLSTKEDGNGNTVYETKVVDNAAPVMCFTQTPSYLIAGDSIDYKYKVIDVIDTSTRATAYYYVLSGEQYSANDYDYDKYEYDDEADSPFIKITSSSSIRIISDENTFVPSSMLNDNVEGLVKLYYKIEDKKDSNEGAAQSDIIFVDWYAKSDAVVDIKDVKGSGESSNFLKLIDETEHKPGLTYAQKGDLTATDTTPEETDPVLYAYKKTIQQFQTAYQKKINEAIAALDGGKLYAGTDSKFYLPSFDNLTDETGTPISFDLADTDEYYNKGDYKYSIYYKSKTSGSSTSLAFNALAISLSEADVNYRFTIFITDSFGNDMRYPTKVGDEIVWEKISTNDVWNEDYAMLLPFFEFHVSYKEATATPPETLSVAYVNSSYSGVSFSIKGVSNTYTAKYNLYVVDRNGLNQALGKTLTYEDFKKEVDSIFDDAQTRKYFTTVKPVSNLLDTDENYELFKELNWNASSITFTPRSVEDFYVVRLSLEDNNSKQTEYQYAVVSASVETTSLKGENDWVEKNTTSIILFSLAGVFLVALIVLLIVKPKDSGDIDEVYIEEVEKQNKKKNKKNKAN